MPDQYERIAEQYARSKHVIWRDHIEQYSLTQLLGDVSGKSILDLACGEGYYSRLLTELGASRVVGLDLSSKMIELAERSERERPLGIEYRVADARTAQLSESFDIVVAAYLLNYAQNERDLLEMGETISRSLKPGGRFVTVNNNPAQALSRFGATRRYGFVKSAPDGIQNGAAIRYTFFINEETFEIENYHLDVATHERLLQKAGFCDVRWHAVTLRPAKAASGGNEYWNDFFVDPPVVLLECTTAAAGEHVLTEHA